MSDEDTIQRLSDGLARIRDRYVRKLPGKDKPICTLCGAEEGTPHSREMNCGWAEDALR